LTPSIQIQNSVLYFSRWTRASFAVFRSIGRMIKIAFLNFDIHTSLFVNLFWGYIYNQDLYELLFELNKVYIKKNILLLELKTILFNNKIMYT